MKLDHMDYVRARKIILRNGWIPKGACVDNSKSTCSHFPEMDDCTLVSPTFCSMAFVKKKQCLIIQTNGDPPDDEMPPAGIVLAVTIRPAPCPHPYSQR
jgi:hypothetical protein